MSDTPITDSVEKNFGEMPEAMRRMERKVASLQKERELIETAIDRVYANFSHVPDAIRAADWIRAALRGDGE